MRLSSRVLFINLVTTVEARDSAWCWVLLNHSAASTSDPMILIPGVNIRRGAFYGKKANIGTWYGSYLICLPVIQYKCFGFYLKLLWIQRLRFSGNLSVEQLGRVRIEASVVKSITLLIQVICPTSFKRNFIRCNRTDYVVKLYIDELRSIREVIILEHPRPLNPSNHWETLM